MKESFEAIETAKKEWLTEKKGVDEGRIGFGFDPFLLVEKAEAYIYLLERELRKADMSFAMTREIEVGH